MSTRSHPGAASYRRHPEHSRHPRRLCLLTDTHAGGSTRSRSGSPPGARAFVRCVSNGSTCSRAAIFPAAAARSSSCRSRAGSSPRAIRSTSSCTARPGIRHAHPGAVVRRAVRESRDLHRAARQQDVAPTVGAIIGAPPTPDLHGARPYRSDGRRDRAAARRDGDRARCDARRLLRQVRGGDADAQPHAQGRRVVFAGAHHRAADRHWRRTRQHRHRQRAALPRHRRQHHLQPRHRQVAGGVRPARHS